MKKLKKIPEFRSEQDVADFWATHDSTEYVDWSKSRKVVFPNLKPSSRAVPIRFPNYLIERLKLLANRRHVPYQSLIKMFLAERVVREFHRQ
jgi:predicted DNA binding CopG/RHH family protein